MSRSLNDIVAHLRACIADASIRTTIIQTEDLAALCDAIDPPDAVPLAVRAALMPNVGWKTQSFEYYAAHYLVGSRLTSGDLAGNMRSLASALKSQYDIGVTHGVAATDFASAKL